MKPVTIRGVTYPSQVIAAKVLGVTPSAISFAALNNKLDSIGQPRGPRPGAAPMFAAKAVTIKGVTYPSQKAAAAALGVSTVALTHYLQVKHLLEMGERQ